MKTLYERNVMRIGGLGIQVIRKAELFKGSAELRMIALADLGGRFSFLLGTDGNRRSVTITARNVKDAVAPESVIPREDIAGKQCGNVADVQ